MVFMPRAGNHILEKARVYIVSSDSPTACWFSASIRHGADLTPYMNEQAVFNPNINGGEAFVKWVKECIAKNNELYFQLTEKRNRNE
jgi:hypothetical protein